MLCSVTQFCLTLQNPMMNCSLPGSSVHGVSQARMLAWVPISLSINPRVTGRVTLYCSARIHTRINKGKRYMGWNSQETRLRFPMCFQGKLHEDDVSLPCTTWDSTRGVVVQSRSHVRLFVTPWTAVFQASLSFTISQSLLKLTSTESVMPSSHLIFCCPLLLQPSVFPSIRVFSNESALCMRWPKY